MRVYCVSDLHTDYKENLQWCEELSDTEYKDATIIIAGDISDDTKIIKSTLQCFTRKYAHVFFVPGNHELWLRKGDNNVKDSFGKLKNLEKMCQELGVHVKPKAVGGVWICPIISWYHENWDTEPDVPGANSIDKMMTDYHACVWPSPLVNGQESLAQRFDSLNEPGLSNLDSILEMEEDDTGERPPLITFSHFLPLQSLLPEKRMLFQPNLAKAVGSNYVAQRIQELKPLAHVFGHTHFLWDATIKRVRYVQWCLGTPKEQRRRSDKDWRPLLLYDTETGLSPQQSCYWSKFYANTKRDPSNVTPAPWSRVPHSQDQGN